MINKIHLCLKLGIESENKKQFVFCGPVKGLTLILKTLSVLYLQLYHFFCQIYYEGAWFRRYIVSSSGYRVHGLDGTGTWFKDTGVGPIGVPYLVSD